MEAIDRLIQFLSSVWERLVPFIVVPEIEGAVILRLGRYRRSLGAGIHWKWPLLEESLTVTTVLTTLRLSPQTLTTKDGIGVVVAAIVKYQIRDVRPYLLGVWDQNDVLADVTMGAIRQAVHGLSYPELIAEPPERVIVEEVRKQVNRFGFKIEAVTFIDLGSIQSIRLIMPSGGVAIAEWEDDN